MEKKISKFLTGFRKLHGTQHSDNHATKMERKSLS